MIKAFILRDKIYSNLNLLKILIARNILISYFCFYINGNLIKQIMIDAVK